MKPFLLAHSWVAPVVFALTGFVASPAWADDCNGNGVADNLDIAAGTSDDCNANGVPDECDVFPVSFRDAAHSPLGVGFEPIAFALADFDSSGTLDLAAVSSPILDGYLAVYTQAAGGAFATALGYPWQTHKAPEGVAAADLDGDGYLDLAVSYNGGFADIGGVDVLLNTGLGALLFPAPTSPVVNPFRPGAIVAGDFDGDGDVDLAVAGSDDLSLLLNNGAAAFSAAAGSPFLAATDPRAMVAGDFDGNGRPDLALTRATVNEVMIALNAGAGFPAATAVPLAALPTALAAGDLDGDADLDLVAASASGRSLSILRNSGGAFAVHSTISLAHAPAGIAADDIDGDGNTDVAATQDDDTVMVLLGPSFAVRRAFPTGAGPGPVVARDINGDGEVDLVVLNVDSYTVSLLLSSPPDSEDTNSNGVPDECGMGGGWGLLCGAGVVPFLPVALGMMWVVKTTAPHRRRR